MIKEIRATTDAAIRNQGASIKTLEIQIGQISKVLQKRGFRSLPSSIEANPRDHVKSISTTVEADSYMIRHIGSPPICQKKGSYGPQFSKSYFEASHIDNSIPRKEKDPGSFTLPCFINSVCFDNALADLGASVSVLPLSTYLNLGLGELAHTKLTSRQDNMPEDIKVPLILERPFLSTAHVKIDVFKRKITLRVGEERIIFKRVKLASSLIKRVYMLSLRERMELDLEARLMGETLVLNRSLDLLNGDYIELNDLNEPLELKRDQVDDLMPTIEEGEVVEEFRTRNDELNSRISDYPSCCDYDKKIRINYFHNLKFSCMIGFEFIHVNFFPILYVNVMSKKFHNSIMKDKLVYKGNNVVGALMNVPIFVGTFFVVTGFAVLEDMDTYRDEGMGDVIFYGPFLKEIGIKARRFDGMITIYNTIHNKDEEYQLKFHSYKDAKFLMEAIEKRYGGNKESKKVQRTLLKQQYENFSGSSSEIMDQTFDRLQKLISQLEIQGEVIEQEDMNLKLLRSLPSEWKTHALIWRNKEEIELSVLG
ncbi:hypothetical protein Tco_0472707 [Tanacetum coccineum]